jgi:thiol peroxidase
MTRPGMMVGPVEHPVQGEMLSVGQPAPDFTLTANDMSSKTLGDYGTKVKVISCVPSLETPVCSAQTRHFNQAMAELGDNVVVLTVSADMPITQAKWCGNEGVECVVTLSDHKTMQFSDDYGVHDTEWRVVQRAAFVLDQNNVVQYAEYVPNIDNEVSFDAILDKARELIG